MIIMIRRASSVLPESNTGEGRIVAEYHRYFFYGCDTFDLSQLLIPLSDLNETKVIRREHMYLDSCKASCLYVHLVKSYAFARVHLMSVDFLISRYSGILPSDDVSALQIDGSEAISLCWRTMTTMTRRASSVLPENNTGEGRIDAAYHP